MARKRGPKPIYGDGPSVKTGTHIPVKLDEAIKAIAQKRHIPRNRVVVLALQQFVESELKNPAA